MRIHRIRLQDYRGIEDHEIELAPTGVTVVEGPNEIGKSSIAEGLNLLFEELDSSGKSAVRDTKPVARDVGPEVEVEMESGPYAFTYRKRFLRGKETVLRVTQPRAESLTGREAHERVREILDETLDEALWKALRITQGAAIGEVALGAIGSLSSALDAEAGTTPAGQQETGLYDRARAEYLDYWTGTGRPKGEAGKLEEHLAAREDELSAIETALKSLEGDVEQVAQLTGEKQRLVGRRAGDEERASELREQWQKLEGIARRVEILEAKAQTAKLTAERAAKAVEDRGALVEKVTGAQAEREQLSKAIDVAAPALTSTRERSLAAVSALDGARKERQVAERVERLLRDDLEHLRDRQALTGLREQQTQLTDAGEALVQAEATLATNKVDEAALKAIRDASTDVQTARARLETGSPSVDIEDLGAGEIMVDGKRVTLKTGAIEHWNVVGRLRIEVPHAVGVELSSGADGDELNAALVGAEAALVAACEKAGARDLVDAESRADSRREARAVRKDTRGAVRSILKRLDMESAEELTTEIATIERRVEDYLEGRSSRPEMPADEVSARAALREAAKLLEDVKATEGRAATEDEAARDQLNTLEKEAVADETRLKAASEASTVAAETLAQARSARSDEALAKERRDADSASRDAAGGARAARAELEAEGPEGVGTRLRNAEAVLTKSSQELRDVEDRLIEVQVRLKDHQEDGLSEKRDAATVERRATERKLANYQRRAAAHKLLYDTLRKAREAAHRAYIGPLRTRIEEFGRVIYGETFGVELTEDLKIASRTVDGETVPFRSLSIGAKEQLGVIARLACATIVAADGGAPLILDDTLGFSDPDRLEAMGAVLGLAGGSCQIIALTCYPDRYRHIGNATIRRLDRTASEM